MEDDDRMSDGSIGDEKGRFNDGEGKADYMKGKVEEMKETEMKGKVVRKWE